MSTIPLLPDDGTGRDWIEQELAKPEYTQARPDPFDQFVNDVWDWFRSLFQPTADGAFGINPVLLVIILALIGAVLLVVFLGRPRAVARRRANHGAVFLDDDTRSVAELRAAAAAAAASGNWSLALLEQYRAIARSLSDRTLIRLRPGTTAQGVAAAAAEPFPPLRQELQRAASLFDAIRYADATATQGDYEFVRGLDDHLDRTRPQLTEMAAS